LADYQTWLPDLKQLGVTIIAASVDTPENARQSVDTQKLAYPVGHSRIPGHQPPDWRIRA
jgi:peroxiredoxin